MDHEEAKRVGEGFVRCMETNDTSVFSADVFCDINVPEWRFQMQGVDAVAAWLKGEQPDGSEVPSWRSDATDNGVIVELAQKTGDEISRNMHRLEVRDGKVVEWTMYCTGVWSVETQEKQRREAPMIRE
jgi:hypothetical protein